MNDLIFIDANGFSMWPFLKPGQKLVIKKMPIRDLRAGDIILYRANNQLVCHRLLKKTIAKGKTLLYARGDNSASLPQFVIEEMFLGKVIGALKNGKMINLSGWKRGCINRLIIGIAPLVRRCKPYYVMLRKFVRGY